MSSHYKPRMMLVTGGAGFIGANFIRHVLKNNEEVKIINLDKLTYAGSLNNVHGLPDESRHHFIQGDITDEKLVKHILQHHNIDTIVHFAAESHVDRSIQSPAAFIHTNVLGTFTLLEAARQHWFDIDGISPQHCRFHHISTDEVFGSLSTDDAPFSETTAYHPRSPYSASKAGSDHLAQAYYHTYGLPVTMSNCSNNYGPYQHTEKFIPTVIRACIAKKPIPIYGNGKNIRDWLFVDDHCSALYSIITQGKIGENYNVGGNNEWENLSLANVICELMDEIQPHTHPHNSLLEYVTDRSGHDFRYAIDASKMKNKLKWTPIESMQTGLRKTIEFYLSLK